MKIKIDYTDGLYSWKPTDLETGIEVDSDTIERWKAIGVLLKQQQKELLKLDEDHWYSVGKPY